jgi:hypothetical protein
MSKNSKKFEFPREAYIIVNFRLVGLVEIHTS